MGLLSDLSALITEHGSATILRERLALLRDQAAQMEDEQRRCHEELARSRQEVADLRHQIARLTATQQFVEYRGGLFRKLPTGDYEPTVFCPECRKAMSCHEAFLEHWCNPCRRGVPIKGQDLRGVLAEVARLYP